MLTAGDQCRGLTRYDQDLQNASKFAVCMYFPRRCFVHAQGGKVTNSKRERTPDICPNMIDNSISIELWANLKVIFK